MNSGKYLYKLNNTEKKPTVNKKVKQFPLKIETIEAHSSRISQHI